MGEDTPVTTMTLPERSGMFSTPHLGLGGAICKNIEKLLPIAQKAQCERSALMRSRS